MKKNISDKIFTVAQVLSVEECKEYIAMTENIGYQDAPVSFSTGAVVVPEIRNNRRVMIDDEQISQTLWQKVKNYVPSVLDNRQAVGLNERIRFYRYKPGQRFAPHMDGYFERENGERSLWTFMLYLNQDFSGGETIFFSAEEYLNKLKVKNLKPKDQSYLVGATVVPQTGSALFFQHQLPHEGAEVKVGCKYVLRTDVMYSSKNTEEKA